MILDSLAGSHYSHKAGISGTVTVPAGYFVTGIAACAASAAGSIAITPGGANQTATALDTITLPNVGWFSCAFLGELGPGTIIVFTTTDAYLVKLAKMASG